MTTFRSDQCPRKDDEEDDFDCDVVSWEDSEGDPGVIGGLNLIRCFKCYTCKHEWEEQR